MSKHTPGPWKYYPELRRVEYGPGDFGGFSLVDFCGSTNKDSDARLIAAAPELLAACKEALSRFEADGYEDTHHGGKTLVALRAAIAKAEGGAS